MQNLLERNKMLILLGYVLSCAIKHHLYNCVFESSSTRTCIPSLGKAYMRECFLCKLLKPGTHHAIFVFCWTQRRRKDDCRMVCAHQRRSSSVDFTNATVVGPIRKTNRSNNCCMVFAGQRHLSHQPTGHRPITVKHFRDA